MSVWQLKAGYKGVTKLLWQDLFGGRSLTQWLYLIALSSLPFILEFTSGQEQHDWLGLFASWTGIVCVILVAEGRPAITSLERLIRQFISYCPFRLAFMEKC